MRHRNYQLLWVGTVISSSGDWMDAIAVNWLVYQMTDSAVYLGLVNLCRMGPILLFTPIAGVAADRVERRRLMLVTQSAFMSMAVVLAWLVLTHRENIWLVLLISAGRGITGSFNQPIRQSIISDLVPREDLRSGVALSSATFNLTRVIGPAIGGILISTVGVGAAFGLNAASYVGVLWTLVLMQFPPRTRKSSGESFFGELVSGFRYLRSQPALFTLVLLALVPTLFGNSYLTMLTVFAQDVLQAGGSGLGFLTAAAAIGAMLGALLVASVGRRLQGGSFLLILLVLYGTALTLFAVSPWFGVSLCILVFVGASQQAYDTMNSTLLQEHVDEEYRGRTMSMLILNRGLVPMGAVVAGFGIELFGPQVTMAAMSAVLILLALIVARVSPAIRSLR
jgi:MFS family permease